MKTPTDYIISNAKKYNGIYIITGKEEIRSYRGKHNSHNCTYKEVECPCCGEKRFVRATLLTDSNKNKMKSTLCSDCLCRSEQVFEQINETTCRTFVNGKEVLINSEDVKKIKDISNFSLQDCCGYIYIVVQENKKRKLFPLHGFLMDADGQVVDHKDHNPLNNTRQNLRIVTRNQNATNSFNYNCNKSGFKNIHLCNRKKKWVVQSKYLGATKRFALFPEAFRYYKENIEVNQKNYSYDLLLDKTILLKYSGIIKDDMANGKGVGLTLFVQNCTHKCKGCQNPETWDEKGGNDFTKKEWDEIVEYFLHRSSADHLTLSGGDPLDNLLLTNYIVANFNYIFPQKKIWLYTGYTWEEIVQNPKFLPIVETVDVIVDGPFIESQKDLTLAFRGSSNQRIIDVKETLKQGQIITIQN